MIEDNTKDLTTVEKLDFVLDRLARIEAQAEEGSNATRSLLERIIQEVRDTQKLLPKLELIHADSRADLGEIKRDLMVLLEEIRNERMARAELAERVPALEDRLS